MYLGDCSVRISAQVDRMRAQRRAEEEAAERARAEMQVACLLIDLSLIYY